jgi:tRNA pseudouridine(38-40) synthase
MRIALGVEYDGTDFHGWQRQRTGRTVQGCLEEALSVADHELAAVCRAPIPVYAVEQVIHIDTWHRDERPGYAAATQTCPRISGFNGPLKWMIVSTRFRRTGVITAM